MLYIELAILAVLAGLGAYFWRRHKRLIRQHAVLEKMTGKLEADLVDRRQIERELAHMASFADMAPISIVELNTDGSIGYTNPTAERLFPDLNSQGRSHPLFEDLDAVVEKLKQENLTLLNRTITIGNLVYDQQVSFLDGGPRLRLFMSDITELKRLDQLKSDFVNMVSHELRTPLSTISASIKMMSGGVLGEINPDQKRALGYAETNIDRLARMINDLLDVSKIEAGKLELHSARVDMSRMVKDVCRSFEPLAQQRGLQIKIRMAEEHIEVNVDPDKIFQVFANLMNNALKFTEHGYIEVSVTRSEQEVECRVADTGPGIPAADLPRVFKKFEQFGAVPRGQEKGTGLGLSLCKGLVELHGGRIWVESRPHEGTEFIFVLPASESDPTPK